jgi:hypothetical protein
MDEKDRIINELLLEHPISELVKFNELDLQEKLAQNPTMMVKYRDLYHKELAKLDKLDDLMEKLVGMRYRYYRFDDNHEWSKPEIEKYAIPTDKKVQRMKKIIRRQKIRVRFFEMCWKAFEKQGWSMKGFIETLRGY